MFTVYRLYNTADELLYVGVTNNWQRRRWEHATDKPWYSLVARAEADEFADARSAHDHEAMLIGTLSPRYNIVTTIQNHAYGGHDIPTEKRSFNIKISPDAAALLDGLAKRLGLSKAGVFEVALRELSERLDTMPKLDPLTVARPRAAAPAEGGR